MGKASRSKQRLTTREKVAVQRAEQRRTEVRKRTMIVVSSVAAVVALVALMVVLKVGSGSSSASALPTGPKLSAIVSQATNVPASTLAAVGKGTTQSPPSRLPNQPALTRDGKPEIFYLGAEYCPFCAAERWAMVVALSRFGTFSNLGVTHSTPNDVYPNTSTLTFHNSTYTSNYVSFSPVEQQDVNKKPLDKPTPAQVALITKYDSPPYVSASSQGSIPFVDFGNKFLVTGSSFTPQVLHGKTWSQISAALADPSSPIAKAVDGTANVLTADICKLTGSKPVSVCSTPPVSSLMGGA